jgi:hypothetical protein
VNFVDPTGRRLRVVRLALAGRPDRLGFFSIVYGDLVLTANATDAAGRPFDYARFRSIQERYSNFIGDDHFDDGVRLGRDSTRHFDSNYPGWRRIYRPEVRFPLLLERATLATEEEANLIRQYSKYHDYELPHWTVPDPPTLSGRYLARIRRIPRPTVRVIEERVAPYVAEPAFPYFNLPSHEEFMAARGYMEDNAYLFGRFGYTRVLSTADRKYGRARTFSEAFDNFRNNLPPSKRRRVDSSPPSVRDYLSPYYGRRFNPGDDGGGAPIPPIETR